MKDQKIIEGNKLIAEFMGAYYCNDDRNAYPDGYWMCDDEFIELPYNINDFKFHSSWDWLMPVVEQIESLHSIIEGKYINVIISQGYVQIEGTTQKIFRNTSVDGSKILSVWLAVVEFLKWYKKQNK